MQTTGNVVPRETAAGAGSDEEPLPASFRDPDGYVFRRDGFVYRRYAARYSTQYHQLMDSGPYDALVQAGLLLPHIEVGDGVLKPEQLRFVSYPYEWCFSQWKDAALATLAIQSRALEFGMSLKDASAFNIQFHNGRPVLIDTFSFETYPEGQPWVAYRQFCEHFLAPLALMAHCDVSLGGALFRTHLGGIPLPLAVRLLPAKVRLNPHLFGHLYVQARYQARGAEGATNGSGHGGVSLAGMRALLDSLQSAIRSLRWVPAGTVWADYYADTNYSEAAMTAKENLVAELLDDAGYGVGDTVWDLGANDGRFSRLAMAKGAFTVAWDVDPAAVEKAYQGVVQRQETQLLPLLQDLTNPSPDQGWAQEERAGLASRGPATGVIALALVHHLALANNVPLGKLSDFFATIVRDWLLIEFVPKEDSQAQRLLANRRDIFENYSLTGFETAFAAHWHTVRRVTIPHTQRTLYLLRRLP